MPVGYITFTQALYYYMKPQDKSLLNMFLKGGVELGYTKDTLMIQLKLDHPDFLDECEECEYRLNFVNDYDGWNRKPRLDFLEVNDKGKWKTVKVYPAGDGVRMK